MGLLFNRQNSEWKDAGVIDYDGIKQQYLKQIAAKFTRQECEKHNTSSRKGWLS